MANSQDGRRQDHGQGDVKNPATDGRLKENRDNNAQQQQGSQGSGDGRGQVKDPENDGRLKQNR